MVGSLERLRSTNRRAVVAALVAEGPSSRAQLARLTGLSRTTVSSLVHELVADGQVVETSDRGTPHKGGSGRPPALVRVAARSGGVAGVDVGHRHVAVAVADRAGTLLTTRRAEIDVDAHGLATLDRIAAMVREAARAADVDQLQAVGMCVPAPIDRRSATVASRILPGWSDLAPAELLQDHLQIPVVADNDANVGALGELHHGAGRDAADLVYLKMASGVGAGIVLGHRLHRGATGLAGEIGHVQIREDGRVCRCGNRGCLETEVSLPRLLDLLDPAYDEPLDAARVLELEARGDAGVRRVLQDAGATLGRALADLCNSLNPELVVVGGPIGTAPSLLQGLRGSVDRYAQPSTAAAVRIVPGELGEDAELRGAVALAVACTAAEA